MDGGSTLPRPNRWRSAAWEDIPLDDAAARPAAGAWEDIPLEASLASPDDRPAPAARWEEIPLDLALDGPDPDADALDLGPPAAEPAAQTDLPGPGPAPGAWERLAEEAVTDLQAAAEELGATAAPDLDTAGPEQAEDTVYDLAGAERLPAEDIYDLDSATQALPAAEPGRDDVASFGPDEEDEVLDLAPEDMAGARPYDMDPRASAVWDDAVSFDAAFTGVGTEPADEFEAEYEDGDAEAEEDDFEDGLYEDGDLDDEEPWDLAGSEAEATADLDEIADALEDDYAFVDETDASLDPDPEPAEDEAQSAADAAGALWDEIDDELDAAANDEAFERLAATVDWAGPSDRASGADVEADTVSEDWEDIDPLDLGTGAQAASDGTDEEPEEAGTAETVPEPEAVEAISTESGDDEGETATDGADSEADEPLSLAGMEAEPEIPLTDDQARDLSEAYDDDWKDIPLDEPRSAPTPDEWEEVDLGDVLPATDRPGAFASDSLVPTAPPRQKQPLKLFKPATGRAPGPTAPDPDAPVSVPAVAPTAPSARPAAALLGDPSKRPRRIRPKITAARHWLERPRVAMMLGVLLFFAVRALFLDGAETFHYFGF